MIKATSKLEDGTPLIILGLSDHNIRLLKEDRPIAFDLKELDLGAQPVLITYKHADGRMAGPLEPDEPPCLPLALTDETLGRLTGGNDVVEMKATSFVGEANLTFLFFSGETEAVMEKEMRGLIDARTIVTREGYEPSELPSASRN